MSTNSFKNMINTKVIKRTDTGMFIRIEDLHIKPGFNKRNEDERWARANEETYEFMKAGGKVPALEVVPRDEGGVWIVEGARRTRTYRRLDAEGILPRVPSKDDPNVLEAWIAITPFVGNDVDRVARIWTSNNQLELTQYEQAMVVKELAAFGLTPVEIAQKVSKKRQHIDFLLILAYANHDVQTLVQTGAVAADVAVDMVRKHGERAGKLLQGEGQKATEQGKTKSAKTALVTRSTVEGRALPKAIVSDMTGLVGRVVKNLPQDTRQALDKYRTGEITDHEHLVTVSVRDLLALSMCSSQIDELKEKAEQRAKEKAEKAAKQEQEA